MCTATARQTEISRRRTTPIVRWVGGKRWLVPMVSDLAYDYLQRTGGRYFEPFLGGGAVALDVGLPGMELTDLCEPLINAFRFACNRTDQLYQAIDAYRERGTDAQTYYEIRAEKPDSSLQRAAQFFYLNATCFNGVFRENSQGEFNVPYGSRSSDGGHSFVSLERLRAFADVVSTCRLLAADFRSVLPQAYRGDFIFVDSPYYDVYDQYLRTRFLVKDHVDLARELQAASQRGAAFVACNADQPAVRRLYRWAHLTSTSEVRRVNRDAAGRGKVDCLLIASSPELIVSAI